MKNTRRLDTRLGTPLSKVLSAGVLAFCAFGAARADITI
ncbi:MAG: hypothetical protein JWP79_2241, partial [Polaromonas sp.]|nr:hypothetical protein [Polaromonas sp.]